MERELGTLGAVRCAKSPKEQNTYFKEKKRMTTENELEKISDACIEAKHRCNKCKKENECLKTSWEEYDTMLNMVMRKEAQIRAKIRSL